MIETWPPAARGDSPDCAPLDLNESPLGPPESAVRAAIDCLRSLHRYPRAAHHQLITALARKWKIGPESLLVTNGVDEAIDLALSMADSVQCTVPGFDAFWARPETQGIPVTRIPLGDNGQPTVSADKLSPASLAFIARPNNPTGTIIDSSWLEALRSTVSLLFIDETYIDFSDEEGYLRRAGNGEKGLCVFRSLSKSLGLAGLRIGVLIAPPPLAARVRERQRFYPADAISLQVATAALDEDDYIEHHRKHVIRSRSQLAGILRQSGLFVDVRDTQANFVIGRCADPAAATDLEHQLRERGIYVRECSLFGYPGRLRMSTGASEDLQKLAAALEDIAG